MKFTITRMGHPAGGYLWMFYSPEGMLIGSVAGQGAKYGEDPNLAVVRAFRTDEDAIAWVKKKCAEFAVPGATFEEVDDDRRIIPAQPGELSRARH